VVVRRGRLAAAGVAPAGTAPWPVIEALLATADTVDPEHEALTEESECILRWLEEPGVRLVHATHPWAVPAHGAGGLVSWLAADSAQRAASPFADRRPLPMSARPARASARAGQYDGAVVTAIVMVSVETDKIPEVAQQIAELDGVSEVYSVAGDADLIAIVRVREFDQIAETIAGRLSKLPGVVDTDTHIAFRAYSRHDLDAAFDIGS
jgi:DNA-binding Lrp family transcriptional regulator